MFAQFLYWKSFDNIGNSYAKKRETFSNESLREFSKVRLHADISVLVRLVGRININKINK